MSRFLLVIALSVLVLPCMADAVVVRMITVLGTIDVELYDSTPVTRANFLSYVNEGAYDNSIFHRSAKMLDGSDFVIQGGGFALEPPESKYLVHGIPTYPPIINEFSLERSNLFGTIAMAKLAYDPNTDTGGPDSATSQWFFNLGDNSANLDYQNGGFTVFGNVVAGQDVMLALAALDRWDFTGGDPNSPFNEMPTLDTFTGENPVTQGDLATIHSAFLMADADGDGTVGAADYIALKRNFGTESGATWEQGDFDGDGDVDFYDKFLLEFSFDQGSTVPAAAEPAGNVPEPATLSLLALAAMAALRRRKNR